MNLEGRESTLDPRNEKTASSLDPPTEGREVKRAGVFFKPESFGEFSFAIFYIGNGGVLVACVTGCILLHVVWHWGTVAGSIYAACVPTCQVSCVCT